MFILCNLLASLKAVPPWPFKNCQSKKVVPDQNFKSLWPGQQVFWGFAIHMKFVRFVADPCYSSVICYGNTIYRWLSVTRMECLVTPEWLQEITQVHYPTNYENFELSSSVWCVLITTYLQLKGLCHLFSYSEAYHERMGPIPSSNGSLDIALSNAHT